METEIRFTGGVIPPARSRQDVYNATVKGKARSITYDASPKGTARRGTYNDKRNQDSADRYMAKEFVAWDGEGGNETDGSHTYFILANSDGASITDRNGVSTVAVFDMFLASRTGVTNVIYGGGYDINMFLRDLDLDSLLALYNNGKVSWNGYWMEWRAGKSFNLRKGENRFTLYDVLPFFQRPFVAACDEYLGTEWESRDEIIREKANRGQFQWDQLDTVSAYNRAELSTLVLLAQELRTRLFRVDIRVSRWDGPGAIATALYKKYGTKQNMGRLPNNAAEYARYGYAGGRFEIIRKGHSESGAYQYDIRSAYPAAIRFLPCLAHGYWNYTNSRVSPIRNIVQFGIYRIEVVSPVTESVTQPQPLWMRNKDGTVFFAEYSHGWYWSPEAKLAKELGGVTIHEGWEWVPDCECNPFDFVEGLYNKRAALKRAGDGAHVGLKLGLNSLYGKLAQQIGWTIDDKGVLKLPPYHCLEWAGWITSHCRAQVYRASMHAPDDVIAFETDAIFSRVPLDLDIGEGLGQWEETVYSSLTYLKSGMYFGTLDNGKEIEKMRGVNKGTLTRYDMIRALTVPGVEVLQAEQTRFVGLGQAINQTMAKWRRWFTDPRDIQVALNGKRIDLLSGEDIRKDIHDGWKETQEGFHDTEFTYQYPVAWINNDDTMSSPEGLTLDEYRQYDSHEV